jgi:hypothetical protein
LVAHAVVGKGRGGRGVFFLSREEGGDEHQGEGMGTERAHGWKLEANEEWAKDPNPFLGALQDVSFK